MKIKPDCLSKFHIVAISMLVLATFGIFGNTLYAQDPGSGFVSPESIPERPARDDIKPVMAGPAVDMLATIRNRGTLLVGVAPVPPMVMHDKNGELVGFSIDLGRKLAEDIGVDVEFLPSSWTHVIPDLVNRQTDIIITGLWVTPQRALVVNYTEPTATEGIYLIANKNMTSGMKTIEDFNRPDVTIAAYNNTIQLQLIGKYFPQAKIEVVKGDDSELKPVLEGKAHGVLIATFAPKVIVQTFPDSLSLGLEKPLQSTVSAMAVRKGDLDFVNFLNSWLTYERDGSWLEERTRYWSETIDWME